MAEFLRLKKSNCKNCYKCIRNCPVKSIRFSAGQANIVPEACILCGQCFVVCPQNAKEIADDTERVRVMLQTGTVVASIAPSFVANYDGADIHALEAALKKLGFAAAEETAVGASQVKKEYERILAEEKPDVLISSCCHSVNLLIQKYHPAVLPYLAPVQSPMLAHGEDIRRRYPGAKVVFIGPCLAKKDEAARYGIIDAVLTFEDLSRWLAKEGIEIERSESIEKEEHSRTRRFPTTGGILASMDQSRAPDYTYLAIDGVENCIAALQDIERGAIRHCFIEMSACVGSCIGGPVMEKYHRSPVRDFARVAAYAGNEDFEVEQPAAAALHQEREPINLNNEMPTDAQLKEILQKMGKTSPEQILNCGSCGYNTCREKAIAIFQGKADHTMCLPFLKERAESFSDNIIRNSPNGILVLNENLEVQQINPAACRILNIRLPQDVLGEPVVRILDPKPFARVLETGRGQKAQRQYLSEYGRYVEQSVVYDNEYRNVICLLRDVTEEERVNESKEEIRMQTIETTDKVIEKQMRVVQEIAFLLGETAAETKTALTKLKESISHE